MQKYPNRFAKFCTAKTYVSRTMKRVKEANGDATVPNLMGDKRGKERAKPVTNNPAVSAILERVCSMQNGSLKAALRECRTLNIKVSLGSLVSMATKLGFSWQKPWHTDVLTPAQKYKRTLFCRNLLRLSRPNLLRVISNWLFTDEKWFDLIGPSPGQWVKADSKAGCKMENQVKH